MISNPSDEIAKILAAVTIHTPTSYSFAGGPPVEVNPAGIRDRVPASHPLPDDPMVQSIQSTLYALCYTRPFNGNGVDFSAESSAPPDPNFPMRLSQANRSRNRWDPGWRIYQLGTAGQIYVQKGERCRPAMPGEYAVESGPGMAPQVGMTVSIQSLRESFQMQPGFYYVFGETVPDQFDDFNTIRFYFNTTGAGADRLVEALSTELNRFQIPFRFKTLADPTHYTRTDAAVLYIARRYYRITAALVAVLPDAVTSELRPQVPLFSKALRPGVGLAEDPGNGESFGMHRCRLVAEGIVDSWRSNNHNPDARMAAVHNRFTMNGMSLESPHLNMGSKDLYELPVAGGIDL